MLDCLAWKNALHCGRTATDAVPVSPSLRAMSRLVRRHKPRQALRSPQTERSAGGGSYRAFGHVKATVGVCATLRRRQLPSRGRPAYRPPRQRALHAHGSHGSPAQGLLRRPGSDLPRAPRARLAAFAPTRNDVGASASSVGLRPEAFLHAPRHRACPRDRRQVTHVAPLLPPPPPFRPCHRLRTLAATPQLRGCSRGPSPSSRSDSRLRPYAPAALSATAAAFVRRRRLSKRTRCCRASSAYPGCHAACFPPTAAAHVSPAPLDPRRTPCAVRPSTTFRSGHHTMRVAPSAPPRSLRTECRTARCAPSYLRHASCCRPSFRALGRSPHAEFTAALHLSAALRGDHLRSHLLPPRRSRVALLRSLFANAAYGSRTMNSASLHPSSVRLHPRPLISHSESQHRNVAPQLDPP
jgi:hypothetical protein